MGISRTSPSSPLLLAPIASGVGTPVELDLSYGGGNYIDPNGPNEMGSLVETTSAPASTSYTNALSYTGSGYLEFLAWWGVYNAGTAGTCVVKLTIDGKVIFTDVSAAAAKIRCAVGNISRGQTTNTSAGAQPAFISVAGRLPFTSSILIEHKYATATGGKLAYKLVKTG